MYMISKCLKNLIRKFYLIIPGEYYSMNFRESIQIPAINCNVDLLKSFSEPIPRISSKIFLLTSSGLDDMTVVNCKRKQNRFHIFTD